MTNFIFYLIVVIYFPLLISCQLHKEVVVELSVFPKKPVVGIDTLNIRCQGLLNSLPEDINVYSILFYSVNTKTEQQTLLVNIEKNRTTWFDSQLQQHAEILLPNTDSYMDIELLVQPVQCSHQQTYLCSMQTSYGVFQSQRETIRLKAKPSLKSLSVFSNGFLLEKTVRQNTAISLTCSGNLGKPKGKFQWSFYRQNINVFQPYFGEQIDSITEDNCQVHGSSTIEYKTNSWDSGLMFRCAIVSPTTNKEINLVQRIQVLGLGIKNATLQNENPGANYSAAIYVGVTIGFLFIILLLSIVIYNGVQLASHWDQLPCYRKGVKDINSIRNREEEEEGQPPIPQNQYFQDNTTSPSSFESKLCPHNFIVKQYNKEYILQFPASNHSHSTTV